MSREWSQEAFQAAAEAPKHFVPLGFATAEPIDESLLASRMRAVRTAFRAKDAKSWLSASGFVAGGFARAAAPDAARHDVIAELAIEPMRADAVPAERIRVAEPSPTVDPQAIFDAGILEGERRASAAGAANADACARLMSALAQGNQLDRPALAQRLRRTVLLLVTQIVGECGISPERLTSRVDDAVRLLADVTEPARLSLHPDDLAMMSGRLAPNIAALADPAIERGGFRLETMSATIEDGPTLWLDQLAAALDRVAADGE